MSGARQGRGRPRASSRPDIEAAAMKLFLADGFEGTPVDAVARAAGLSRASFFRYFPTKSSVVFNEFDVTIERLRRDLASSLEHPVTAIRDAIVSTTRAAAANPTWIERFVLMDRDPALRRDITEHWAAWMVEICEHLGRHYDISPIGVEAAATAGAFQAAYVSVFRSWSPEQSGAVDALMTELSTALGALIGPTTVLVETPGISPRGA